MATLDRAGESREAGRLPRSRRASRTAARLIFSAIVCVVALGGGPRERVSLAAAPVAGSPSAPPPAATPPVRAAVSEPEAAAKSSFDPNGGRGSAIALQGGWWSLEGEWRSRWGLYVAVGIPWAAFPLALLSGATWAAPVGARIGYQYPFSARWSLRASAHAAFMVANEKGKCGCASDEETTQRTFLFAEAGIRYEGPSGFVAGADLPLYGVRLASHPFPPPESLAFTQVYVGYSWGR